MKKRYQMTQEQFAKLMEASQPVPYIVANGTEPSSPIENANRAWQALAKEMGFVWDTARPISGEPPIIFEAEEA